MDTRFYAGFSNNELAANVCEFLDAQKVNCSQFLLATIYLCL